MTPAGRYGRLDRDAAPARLIYRRAHVAAIADASVCPILTLDAAKWRQHAEDLDDRLHFIEIDDPDQG